MMRRKRRKRRKQSDATEEKEKRSAFINDLLWGFGKVKVRIFLPFFLLFLFGRTSIAFSGCRDQVTRQFSVSLSERSLGRQTNFEMVRCPEILFDISRTFWAANLLCSHYGVGCAHRKTKLATKHTKMSF
jgi:hypothetical protein